MRRRTARLRSLSVLTLAILLPAAAQAQPSSAAAVSGRWTRIGPDGGGASALAAAPSRPATIYAASGGVFRSTDGGDSWTYAGAGLGRFTVVDALAADASPGTVYALTYAWLFKSTNSGGSWSRVSLPGSAGHSLRAVAADPRRPGVVYVALDGGRILASADRGRSWKRIGHPPDTALVLAIDPVHSTTLYAGTKGSGAFKTTDAGGHWKSITGSIHPALNWITELAIDPRHPQTLFLSNGDAPYRSVDGGGHWTKSSTGLGESPFILALAVDPGSSTVFAGTLGDGVFRSTDGGLTWQRAGAGMPDLDVDVLLATGSGLYAGNGTGVSVSRDGALTWRTGRGLKGIWVFSLAIDSQDPPRMYACDGISYLYKSASRGASWTRLTTPPGPFSFSPTCPVVVHPNDPQQIELGYFGSVARSDDGGHSWVDHFSIDCVVPGLIVLHPSDSEVLYTSGEIGDTRFCDSLCTSFKTDHGQVSCLLDAAVGPEGMRVMAVDPAAPDHLFGSGDKLYHSMDAGATWSVLSSAIRPHVLLFDPVHPGTLYFGVFPGGVARSADGGATWKTSTAGLPTDTVVLSMAIDPTLPSTLYAATSSAVYRSTDSGATWAQLGTGLEEVEVQQIVIDPLDPAILYAAAYTGGVMMLRVRG